jgi:hypothetical protein
LWTNRLLLRQFSQPKQTSFDKVLKHIKKYFNPKVVNSLTMNSNTMNNTKNCYSSSNNNDGLDFKQSAAVREVDPTDFYFERPNLQFPRYMNPQARKVCVSPSPRLWYDAETKQRKIGYNSMEKFIMAQHTRCPTLSPGSQGTDTTLCSTEHDDDDVDNGSCCGSLTYSVESGGEMAYILDEDRMMFRKKKNDDDDDQNNNKCFQLFGGVISIIANALKPEPIPKSSHSIYFEFDEHFRKNEKAIR